MVSQAAKKLLGVHVEELRGNGGSREHMPAFLRRRVVGDRVPPPVPPTLVARVPPDVAGRVGGSQ
jgi:hypothetical protein